MTTENLVEITWEQVRKGDVLLHENGDRLTVDGVSRYVEEFHVSGVWRRGEALRNHGFTPYRRKPELPTEPGAYLDKDGNAWVLKSEDSYGAYWLGVGTPAWLTAEEAAEFAPFTRLVPMPTEEQVHEAVAGPGDWISVVATTATERVMALLAGKEADSE